MANIRAEKDGLLDGMPRDERGFWKPDKEIGLPNPVLSWPPKPYELAKWLKEYLWPFNIIYLLVAILTWIYLTPEMARMTEFRAGWILEVFFRNQLMLIAFTSALACEHVDAEDAGISVQVVAELDEQKPEIPLERSSARQHVLEYRQRRHDLDRV